MKQNSKAKALLTSKTVLTAAWTAKDSFYLERLWLLAADVSIQAGKTDVAVDLLQRILKYNMSCTRAHEYLGHVRERDGDFKGAAECYEKAWRFEKQSNPSMGYKLAFVYLRAKRYFDSIDICHVILQKYPQYPKIRKEVLEKARACIKITC